jgi:protein gp37
VSKKSDIQWCDGTVNPTMGCEGCELWNPNNKICYAGILHARRRNNPGFAKDFNSPEMFPGRVQKAAAWSDLRSIQRPEKPWLNGYPRVIFLSDMSDALSKIIPFDYLEEEIIRQVTTPAGIRHIWQWLTKRPERMAEFSQWLLKKGIQWPENLWAGTSLTTQSTTSRIAPLLQVGDANTIRFLSVEPQWEAINLSPRLPELNWVIQGGQSGKHDHPFDLDWAWDMLDQCKRAEVPYFLKQLGSCVLINGNHVKFKDAHGGDWSEWPTGIQVRELPRPAVAVTAAGQNALLGCHQAFPAGAGVGQVYARPDRPGHIH